MHSLHRDTRSVTLHVFVDASQGDRARRGCLYFLECPAHPHEGALIHWSSTGLPPTVSSSASEIQAIESGTATGSRLHEWLTSQGLATKVIIYSDARTAIYQVLKGKDLAPPYSRYVSTIRSRLELMGAKLMYLPTAVHPADPLTKIGPTPSSVSMLASLCTGAIPSRIWEEATLVE